MVSSPASRTVLAILTAAIVLVLGLAAPWTAHAFSTTAAIAVRPGSTFPAVVVRHTSLHSWNPNNSNNNSGGGGGFSPNGSSRSSSSNNNYNGNDRRDAGRFSPRGDARRDGMGDSNRRDGNINGNINGNGSSSSSSNNSNNNSNNDRRDEARPLVLYGHPGSRSPMVRWAAYELGIANLLREGDLRDNPHPFGKIPCLTDDGGEVGVFESGAILQYLHNKYFDADYEYDYDDDDYDDDDDEYENGNKRKNDSSNSLSSFLTGGAGTNGSSNRKTGTSTGSVGVGLNGLNGLNDLFNINSNKKTPRKLSASKEAALASWVVWANASLEPICFVPDTDSSNNMSSNRRRDGDVTGLRPHETGLKRRTGLDDIDRLDEILENVSRRPDADRTTNGISNGNANGGPSSSTSVSSSNSGALTSSASAYLLGQDVFTVADVAVSSYLLFALRFYPDTDFTRWPNIMRYMAQCVSRDAYGRAFGRDVQQMLLDLLVVMNGGRPFETGNDRRLGRKNGNRNIISSNSNRRGPSSLVLYGHPSSQSPIVSWAAYELDLDVPMGDLSRNPHPFGRIPCLTDDDGKIKVFETGAILQYLQDNYGDRRFDRKGGNNNKWDRGGRLNGDRPNGSDRMDNDVGRGDRRTNNNNNNNDRDRERERWEFGNKRESVDGKEYSAQVNSWVVWANAELEPICCYVDEEEYDNRLDRLPGRPPQRPPQSQPKRFTQPLQRRPEQAQIERMSPSVPPPPPRMGRRDTGFYNRPGRNRAYDELEQLNILLGQKKEMQQKERAGRGQRRDGFNDDDNIVYLVGDDFSLADVAVASYLLYIPQNFPGTDLSQWPHLVDYMRYCADRPGYAAAFGPDLQAFVLDELDHFDRRFPMDGDDDDRFGGPPPRGVATGPRGREGYSKDRSMMSPRGVDRGGGGGWDRRGQNGMVGEPNGLRTTPPPPGLRRPGGVGPNDPLRDPRGAPPDPNGWTGPNGLGRIGPDGLRDDDDDNYRGGRQLFSPSFRR